MFHEFVMVCGVACAGLSIAAVVAEAAGPLDHYESRSYESPQGGMLPYRLLRPDIAQNTAAPGGKRYPLVVFFHGAGERGTDNQKQLVHGMSDFAADDVRQKYPAFVLAPQCPEGAQWVDTPWSAEAHTMPEKPTAPMRQTLELIGALSREFPIDPDRIYLTGLSMGGFGVWDALQRQPERFAAAVPICGGGDPAFAKRIAAIPVWAFHGDSDTAVIPKRSREMISALREVGGEPKYTEYPNTGHNSWTATYANREVYAWLFAQRRPAR